jgi:iron complex outermembrane recepter protein
MIWGAKKLSSNCIYLSRLSILLGSAALLLPTAGILELGGQASAQSMLPAVSVEAPAQRSSASKPRRRSSVANAARRVSPQGPRPADANVAAAADPGRNARETANGPVNGYVARRSATGTKTDTPILENAQSISVVTRDQIDQQGALNLNQAVRYTSGVTPESRGAVGSRYDLFKVRGFDAVSYLNGLKLQKMNFVSPQVDPYLLERIEILKGPASVLYGQSPTGGLLNQVSKRPTATPFGEVGVRFGNFAHSDLTFDFGGPVDKDGKVLYRLTGIGQMEDGQVSQTQSQRVAIAPSVSWIPDTDTSLTLTGLYQADPKAGSYAGVPSRGSVQDNPLGRIPRNFNPGEPGLEVFDREQSQFGYFFQHKFSDQLTFRSNGQVFGTSQEYGGVYGSALAANNRTLTRAYTVSQDELTSLAFDNQIEAKFGVGSFRHTVLAGVDVQSWDGFYRSGTISGVAAGVPSIDIFAPVYGLRVAQPSLRRTDVTGQQYGIYVQDEIRIDRWVATLAGRMDWAELTTGVQGAAPQQSVDQAPTGRASLLYLFDSGIAPYFSFAQSFSPQAGTDFTGRAFKPEHGQQYEVGVKYQPIGYNALFTAALFDLTRENLLTTDLQNPLFSVQVGAARSRGLELEGKVSIDKTLNVVASYTYLDTIYTRDNSGLQGLVPVGVPRHMAALWGYYSFAPDVADGLSIGAGVRYTGSTFNTNNTIQVPSYTLVDATVNYDLGKLAVPLRGFSVNVNAKNLLDTTYVGACYTSTTCAYGYGRTVLAGLRYRW